MSFKLLKVGRARVLTRRIGRAALVAAAICVATAPSPSWAATAPDLVTNEALFWLDASTLDAAAGTELDSWADARGGGEVHPEGGYHGTPARTQGLHANCQVETASVSKRLRDTADANEGNVLY